MTESEIFTPCVGGLAYDGDGRILLIRRGNEPGRGRWSLPGGRVEIGENDADALVREMREETGLHVEPGRLIGRVTRGRYAIADYACTVVGGTLQAGDDALDARWCEIADLTHLPLVDELFETLDAWGALPRPCAETVAPATVSAHERGQPRGSGRPACSPPRASP